MPSSCFGANLGCAPPLAVPADVPDGPDEGAPNEKEPATKSEPEAGADGENEKVGIGLPETEGRAPVLCSAAPGAEAGGGKPKLSDGEEAGAAEAGKSAPLPSLRRPAVGLPRPLSFLREKALTAGALEVVAAVSSAEKSLENENGVSAIGETRVSINALSSLNFTISARCRW